MAERKCSSSRPTSRCERSIMVRSWSMDSRSSFCLWRAVEEQARTLLGADLAIASRRAFTAEEESWIQEIGGEQSRETSFSSMIYFPASGGTRLVQVRALSGGFPFYGRLETEPPGAEAQFRQGRGALVEQNLLLQFGAR